MSPPEFTGRLLPVAEDDLDEILAFVTADNLTAALDLSERMEKRLAKRSSFSKRVAYRTKANLPVLDIAFLIIDDYLVFYTIERRTVLVHRILHGARDYKDLL